MNHVSKLLVLSALFLLPAVSSAATLYLSPTETEMARGETQTFSLRLDVDRDECINAIDGVLTYSTNIEPVDISRGQSIMSMWVEEPTIDRTARTITFAGGIPNGYCGRIDGDPRLTNNILDVVFQSPGFVIGGKRGTSTEPAEIAVGDATQVYLNDGFGTRTSVSGFPASITLLPQVGNIQDSAWGMVVLEDTTPPEEFSIMLAETDNAFSGHWFISFNTTDKQSGIDHYEVMEEPLQEFWSFRWGAVDAPWITVEGSTYELKDQSLNSTIRVKAIDKAGNEYVASLVPDPAQRTLSHNTILVMIAGAIAGVFVLGAVLLYFILRMVRRRRTDRLMAAAMGMPAAQPNGFTADSDDEEVYEEDEEDVDELK